MSVAVILPAAGLSTRFGRNKLTENLAGVPVFLRTLNAFLSLPVGKISQVVIVHPPGLRRDDVPFALEVVDPRVTWVAGGATRAESVRAGLAAVPPGIEWVAVHDAARPLVSRELIDRCLAHAAAHGNASPAMPVKLTIKEATGPLPAVVRRTLIRSDLWEMQTPQVMRREDLQKSFADCPLPLEQITDDAQLLELCGHQVWLVAGEERNLKITTPADLRLAEAMLSNPSDPSPSGGG